MEQEETKTTAAAGVGMPPETESWVQLHESELTELMQKQAKAAITELKRQEKQERKKEKYHNTFTLMKCYRDAVFHIENAISDGQQLELKGMTDEQQRTYLESIRRTRFKTLIMTAHIDKAVEEISGVTSVIYSTNSMGQHGDTYVGQRIEARDIDVVGHINTRDKAQALELRRRMLKIFNPELSATLVYEYGGFKRVIDCRAYGEPKILKKEVLYEFDLQIECLNPFWREEEETKEDIASWVAAWHFPCVIEKDSTKSMIYGYRAESVIVDCYNEGDVSTGMRIRFTALGTVSNPILLNVDTEEFIQINATMKTGDVIEINTKYGSKGAKLIRDGVETDYFRYIDVDSTFMQLAIGDNMFRYDAASGVNSLEVSIFYSKEFLGV